MIGLLIRIIKLNVTEYNGTKQYFPQMCADVFSCLPDSFVDDIGSNDYLMDLFFEIPQGTIDCRWDCFSVVSDILEWQVAFVKLLSDLSLLLLLSFLPICN